MSNYWRNRNPKSKTAMYLPATHSKPSKKSLGRWLYGSGKTTPIVNVATWNVNGIRASKAEVELFIRHHAIDILCVNETKIDELTYDQKPIEISGYSAYWNFCKVSSGYSGVAVFSKFLPLRMEEDLPQPKHQHEGRLITLEFQKFYIVAVYVPNSGSQQQRLSYRVNEWDVDFKNYCEALKCKKDVLICGDLNVVRHQRDIHMSAGGKLTDRKMPGCNLHERRNIQTFLKAGWVDTWREQHPDEIKYTWWNLKINGRKNGIGWRIDYILANEQMKGAVVSTTIHDQVMGSDHCPVSAVINLDLSCKQTLRNYEQEEEDMEYNQNRKKLIISEELVHFLDVYDENVSQLEEPIQEIPFKFSPILSDGQEKCNFNTKNMDFQLESQKVEQQVHQQAEEKKETKVEGPDSIAQKQEPRSKRPADEDGNQLYKNQVSQEEALEKQ